MFLTSKNLLPRFHQRLNDSEHIRIASAWATTGKALESLERWAKDHPSSLQSIIGIHGNATDPDALVRLAQLGHLRIADRSSPMFHPKVYIFEGRGALVAWLGSANFTTGGFKSNEETVLEVTGKSDCQAALKWFGEQWSRFPRATSCRIEQYRQQWRRNPPKSRLDSIARGELVPVEGEIRTKRLVDSVSETLESGNKFQGVIDTPSPYEKSAGMQMYLHELNDVDVWCSFNNWRNKKGNRVYWNCLGVGGPPGDEGAQVPVVELNPRFQGGLNLNFGVVFLEDKDDRFYLAHTGRVQVQGLGRTTVRKSFLQWFEDSGSVVTVPRPKKRDSVDVAVIGQIEADSLKKDVLSFVLNVKEWKDWLRTKTP